MLFGNFYQIQIILSARNPKPYHQNSRSTNTEKKARGWKCCRLPLIEAHCAVLFQAETELRQESRCEYPKTKAAGKRERPTTGRRVGGETEKESKKKETETER